MQKSSDGSNNFDEARAGQPRTDQPIIGDADNVQKTSYVVGQGTDPDAPDRRSSARVSGGKGMNVGLWVAVGVALLIAIFYGASLFG